MTRDGDLMIEFKNVTKKYREMGVTAIDNVSFKIEKGEFVFLIGATGAGKTSAARLILREEIPDSGEIIIDKENIGRLRRRELPYLRRKIGVVFQDFKLLPYKTVFEKPIPILHSCRAVKNSAPQWQEQWRTIRRYSLPTSQRETSTRPHPPR